MEPATDFAERRVLALERIALLLRWTAATGTAVFVVWLLGDVLLLVFAAALLALGLRGLANLLSRVVGIKSDPLLVAIVVMLVLLLGLGGWWGGPRLVSEASQLQNQMVHQMARLRGWLDATSWGDTLLHQLPVGLGGNAEGAISAPRISGIVAGALWSADSDEGGHLFQSDRGHHSNLMAASLASSRGPVLVMSRRRSRGQAVAHGLGQIRNKAS